jgi:hypothetical protein
VNGQQLMVRADDTGHRALPLWLPGLDFKLLWLLLDRPARDAVMAGVLEETAARLLHAAGSSIFPRAPRPWPGVRARASSDPGGPRRA